MGADKSYFSDPGKNFELIATLEQKVTYQLTAKIDDEVVEVGGALAELKFGEMNSLASALKNMLTSARLCEPELLLIESSALRNLVVHYCSRACVVMRRKELLIESRQVFLLGRRCRKCWGALRKMILTI